MNRALTSCAWLAMVAATTGAAACGDSGRADSLGPDASPDAGPDATMASEFAPVATPWDDVAVAARCNPMDGGQNCLEPARDTIRIDDEDRLAIATSEFDETNGVLRLQLRPGASLPPGVRVGAILHRGRKDRRPLLHRITAMDVNGGDVRLRVARARVKDAFARGRIRVRLPLSDEGTAMPLDVAKQTAATANAISLGIGPKDCAGVVFDKTLATVNAVGNVKLELEECRFRLTAYADATLIWDTTLVNVDKLEVVVGGGIDAALHSKLTLGLSGGYGESKQIWVGPPAVFSIGGIVITLNPSVRAGYSLSGKAVITSAQGFDLTDSVEVGFGYSDRLGWYSVDERTSTFSKYGPTVTVDGNVTAKAWVEPVIDIKAFGFVGGSITLKGFAEAQLTSSASQVGNAYTGEICTQLDVGLTPTIGAVAELVGVTLFSEYVELFTVRKTLLPKTCSAYTGPVYENCSSSSECCNDGACPPPATPGLTVECQKQQAVSDGDRYTCQTIVPDNYCVPGSTTANCDDGIAYTKDECIDYACTHRVLGASESTAGLDPAAVTPACAAPSCCYLDSDCADGVRGTVDTCVKPLPLPSVKGSCESQLPRL